LANYLWASSLMARIRGILLLDPRGGAAEGPVVAAADATPAE
jgi:hypothetical protein